MNGFWDALPRPFFVQAPMEDVTDAAFRGLIVSFGRPHVMYTEFTSADGLVLAPEHGQRVLRKKLLYTEQERPIVAQLFSAIPERMERAAAIVAELGFDGLDINMGCPDRAIEKSGCGAALIRNPELARELIRAAKRGIASSGRPIPVSVKTRIGYGTNELEEWLPQLLSESPAAIAIHARTRKQLSLVPADWRRVAEAAVIRDAAGSETLIIGNGDALDLADARSKADATGCDGVMLGRAIFGNPWLYAPLSSGSDRPHMPTREERIAALMRHIEAFESLLSDTTNYAVMKKHFKAYISGWHDAKELRMRLMETRDPKEARALLAGALGADVAEYPPVIHA